MMPQNRRQREGKNETEEYGPKRMVGIAFQRGGKEKNLPT